MNSWIISLFFLPIPILSHPEMQQHIPVGVVRGPETAAIQDMPSFWSRNYSPDLDLLPKGENVKLSEWDSSQIVRAVCSLLKSGIHGLISTVPARHYATLKSYAQRFRIPLLTTCAPVMESDRSNLEVTLIPDSSDAIADLMKYYKWESFAFFYDNDDGPQKLQKLMNATNHQLNVQALWRISSYEGAIRYLELVQPEVDNIAQCVILSTTEKLADDILINLSMNMRINQKFHLLLMEPVGVVQEVNQFRTRKNCDLTKLSLIDTNSYLFKDLEKSWATVPFRTRKNGTEDIPYSALIWRELQEVVHEGFYDLFKSSKFNFTTESIDCMKTERSFASSSGSALPAEYIKKVVIPSGITGKVQFSPEGKRVDYKFNIFEITHAGNKNIGTWSQKGLLDITKETDQDQKDGSNNGGTSALKQKITVVSIINQPYLKLKSDSDARTGNDRYEGYMKDVLDAVANDLDWDYQLNIVKDSRYGTYNGSHWNGMIGELVKGEADVIVADLTMSSFRETAVDFSKPVMTLGLNILMKKPKDIDMTSSSIGILGFIQVWSYEIWLLIALFYFALGGATYAVSHVVGEPDRIRSLDTKLSDRLSLCSSFWFVLGSLAFRSTGIYPRSSSHRLLTIIWWAFSLILLVAYISSLSFVIIGKRTTGEDVYSRNSFDILKSAIEKGHPKLGAISGGSTARFFKWSNIGLYREFGKYLIENEGVLVKSTAEGVKRVTESNGDYAMITESPSSHHYANLQPCQMVVSTGFLDRRAYGFAFNKGSVLGEAVDHALMNLMEDGVLRHLYEKWWHLQSQCEDPYLNILPTIYSNSLSLKEVSGLFCFLLVGMIVSAAAGVFEYVVQSKRLSVDK